MSGRTRRTVLSALALATAGCLRFADGEPNGTADATPDRTTAPAATDATTATTTSATPTDSTDVDVATIDGPFPPGVDENGASLALLDEHEFVLSRTSYEYGFETDPKTNPERKTIRVDGDRRLARYENPGRKHVIDGYTDDGTRFLHRAWYAGETAYSVLDELDVFIPDATGRDLLGMHVRGARYVPVAKESRDGTTVFHLEPAEITDAQSLPSGGGSIDAYEARMTVRADGVVVAFESTIRYANQDRPNVLRLHVDGIGSTSVVPPDWTAVAADRMPRFDAEMAADRTHVALRHTGGALPAMPTDLAGYNGDDGTNEHLHLKDGLPADGPLYLSLAADHGLRLTRSPPSNVPRRFADVFRLELWMGVSLPAIRVEA